MPRFYFDLRGGSEEFHDEEGLEFPSLDDATEGAFDAARDLISEAKRAGGSLNSTCDTKFMTSADSWSSWSHSVHSPIIRCASA